MRSLRIYHSELSPSTAINLICNACRIKLLVPS
nr:MAG TPA: hypothetical protein [Caudoviricetes sp.]